jgi:hypothetical protein
VFHCGSMRCGVHGRIADGVWAVRTVGAHRRLFHGRPRTGRVGVFRLDMRRRVGHASLCPPGGPVVPLGWAGKAGALDGQGGGPGELDGGLGRAAVCRCSTASWWAAEGSRPSFHADGHLDSRSRAGIWTARRNTKRRHTRRDHR